MPRVISLAISLGAAYAVAALGSAFTLGAIDSWYGALSKPPLNPPNWIFGPVWTALYALMAIAAWLVYEKRMQSKEANKALAVYAVHLGVNALWSIVFFGLHAPLAALGVIIVLLALIGYTAFLFYRVRSAAGYLLLPYIAWVSFATYLNLMIVILN